MTTPQLLLFIEARAGDAALTRVQAALDAVRIASAIIAPPTADGPTGNAAIALVKPIVQLLQAAGVAALIDRDVTLARATGADGVHFVLGANSEADPAAMIASARAALGKGQIVGIEIASGSRHDAMVAGEAGADYIGFAGANQSALVTWWAELFEPPCVAFGSGTIPYQGVTDPHETADLAAAGADFIAVALNPAQTAADIQATLRAHADAMAQTVV
ncbi:MAG: thiamine phosphate synthase [Hyphomicrobiaceae bacterium]|nr:thiamine phosphate synthase [Hyphomicrobiaceae bacterium]